MESILFRRIWTVAVSLGLAATLLPIVGGGIMLVADLGDTSDEWHGLGVIFGGLLAGAGLVAACFLGFSLWVSRRLPPVGAAITALPAVAWLVVGFVGTRGDLFGSNAILALPALGWVALCATSVSWPVPDRHATGAPMSAPTVAMAAQPGGPVGAMPAARGAAGVDHVVPTMPVTAGSPPAAPPITSPSTSPIAPPQVPPHPHG